VYVLSFSVANLVAKFKGSPLDWGLELSSGGFYILSLRYISGRGEIKPRLQFITNKNSYKGFPFMQKSMTLNDLEW